MRELRPYLAEFRGALLWRAVLGLTLAVLAGGAAVALMGVAGWFVATAALAGAPAAFAFTNPSAGVRILALLRGTARYGDRLSSHQATFTFLARLRVRFFARALGHAPASWRGYRSSDLLQRVVADIDALDHVLLQVLIPTIATALVALTAAVTIGFWSPGVAALLAGALLISGVVLPGAVARLGRTIGQDLVTARTALRTGVIEALEGLPEVRSYGVEAQVVAALAAPAKQLSRAQGRLRRLSLVGLSAGSMLTGLTGLAVLVVTAGSIRAYHLGGPAAVALCLVCLAVMETAEVLPGAYGFWGHARAAATRINLMLASGDDLAPQDGLLPDLTRVPLAVRDLSYRYHLEAHPVFTALETEFPVGSWTAITGASGAGKSTLLQLLAGELAPETGSVSAATCELHRAPVVERVRQITLVAHDDHLFEGTIAENLRVARPQATDEELAMVLGQTRLGDLAQKVSDVLKIPVGRHGMDLSGGQRRRLSLARALLRKPAMLLLDEPTDGVDATTAAHMLGAIRNAYPHMTVIVATHDPVVRELSDQEIALPSRLIS